MNTWILIVIIIIVIAIAGGVMFMKKPLLKSEDIVSQKRSVIEKAYPELQDFESQDSFAGQSVIYDSSGGQSVMHDSFAGQSVTHTTEDDDYYFAYMVGGSGVYFVSGTCYKVDAANEVTKTGEFKNDPSKGLPATDINPKDCSGEYVYPL